MHLRRLQALRFLEGHSFSPEGTGRPMIDLCELLDILTESLLRLIL